MLNAPRLLLAAFTLTLCAACGQSHADIVAPYLPQLDELRVKLASLADRMPAPGSVETNAPRKLAPPLVLYADDTGGNAFGLMFEELSNIEAHSIPLNLNLDYALSTALQWSGESRRNDSYAGGDHEFMKRILQSATAARYLVVHRVTGLGDPVAVDRKHFKGGWAEIDGVVFDLTDLSILASYTLRVETPEDVKFIHMEGDNELDAMERFAHSALWEEARQTAASRLRELTGATVKIN